MTVYKVGNIIAVETSDGETFSKECEVQEFAGHHHIGEAPFHFDGGRFLAFYRSVDDKGPDLEGDAMGGVISVVRETRLEAFLARCAELEANGFWPSTARPIQYSGQVIVGFYQNERLLQSMAPGGQDGIEGLEEEAMAPAYVPSPVGIEAASMYA